MIAVGIVLVYAFVGYERVAGRCNRDVCTKPNTVFERNRGYVEKSATVVEEYVVAKVNVHAVFTVERRKRKNGFAF